MMADNQSTILNVGCGQSRKEGQFGIDVNPRSNADLIHDLNDTPWPVEDNRFDEVLCYAILEHLENFYGVMEEIWRVAKKDALVHINVPHYTDTAAYTDPTHVNYLTSYSFDSLEGDKDFSYYTEARFKIVELKVHMLSLYRLLLIQWLINLSIKYRPLRSIRKFWENYLSFIIRGKSISVVLRVVKKDSGVTPDSQPRS